MNNFIDISDYDATVHRDILDAITRSDASLVEICEDRAISEMRGYLSSRYDCDKIFSQQGEDRHPLILMMCLDVAIYHLFCIHNPQKMSKIREDRYKRAVEWMERVSKFQIAIDGAPVLSEEQTKASAPFQFVSNIKRHNHL